MRWKIRTLSTFVGYPLAFVVWAISGFSRDGAVAAAWISIIVICIAALTHLGTSLFIGLERGILAPAIVMLGGSATIPVGTLVWAHHHGWAWLWTVSWVGAGVTLYQALWEGLIHYRNKHDWSALARIMLDRQIGLKTLLRWVRWLYLILFLAFLTLAQVTALPKPVMVALLALAWTVGLVFGGLQTHIYKENSRQRTIIG